MRGRCDRGNLIEKGEIDHFTRNDDSLYRDLGIRGYKEQVLITKFLFSTDKKRQFLSSPKVLFLRKLLRNQRT